MLWYVKNHCENIEKCDETHVFHEKCDISIQCINVSGVFDEIIPELK